MENNIHKTAIVHPDAILGQGVIVGPYSIIEAGVVLKDNVSVGAHCVIAGNTTVGRDCKIFSSAVVGSIPQDKKHSPKDRVFLEIGDNNVIREFVTMNPGTIEGGGKTIIGNNNLFMAYSHVAHDCRVGNNCVFANVATLAGHVTLEDNTTIGGLSAVHQFVKLGRLSIIGGCSKVVQDVPPFSMVDGHPATVAGINAVGLKRAGFSSETSMTIKRAFKILFKSELTRKHAVEEIKKEIPMIPEIQHLISFVESSERGLCG